MLAILVDTLISQRIEEHKHSAIEKHLRDAHIRETKIFRNNSLFLRNVMGNLHA